MNFQLDVTISISEDELIWLESISKDENILYSLHKNEPLISKGLIIANFQTGCAIPTDIGKQILQEFEMFIPTIKKYKDKKNG